MNGPPTPPPLQSPKQPTKRGRGRPVGSSVAASREDVVDAAIRAVRRDGPGVTMESIAAEAGVTKPVLYRAVGDKEAIAVAVAEYLSQRVDSMTNAILESAPPSRERFEATTRSYFELLRSDRELFLFVEYGWGSHDGVQLETMIERAAEPFIRAASKREGGDRVRPQSRTFAYAAVGALRTVAVMWLRNPYCDLDELAHDVTEFVFRQPGREDSRQE